MFEREICDHYVSAAKISHRGGRMHRGFVLMKIEAIVRVPFGLFDAETVPKHSQSYDKSFYKSNTTRISNCIANCGHWNQDVLAVLPFISIDFSLLISMVKTI